MRVSVIIPVYNVAAYLRACALVVLAEYGIYEQVECVSFKREV